MYDTYVTFQADSSQAEGKVVFRYRGGDVLVRDRKSIWYVNSGQYTVTRKVPVNKKAA